VLERAYVAGVPVTPYGAGTGIAGNAVPAEGGVSLDTTRMDAVFGVRPDDFQVDVQPGVDGCLHLFVEVRHEAGPGLRADVSRFVGRVANGERLDLIDESVDELVVDVGVDDDPLGADAGLPAVEVSRSRAGPVGVAQIVVHSSSRDSSKEQHAL
jgi:hypothetical protein